MTPNDPPPSSPPDLLDAVIAEYVQQVEAGVVPERAALLARHPDLAERLRAFFADYDRLDRQAAELNLALAQEQDSDTRGRLAEALGAVAGRLEPGEAAGVCAEAARLLNQALDREADGYVRGQLDSARPGNHLSEVPGEGPRPPVFDRQRIG